LSSEQRFYPSIKLGVRTGARLALFTLAAGLATAGVSALVREGPSISADGLLRLIAIAPLFFVGFIAFSILLGRFMAIRVTPQGVVASSPLGSKRFTSWNEIDAVNPYWVYGLRMLRLENSKDATYALMALHIDDLRGLRDYVIENAGPRHPMALWLSAQSQAA
jgi:hypothetical protein